MYHNKKIIVSLIASSLFEKIQKTNNFPKNASAHNLSEEYYQVIYNFLTKKIGERFPKRLLEKVD